MFDETSQVAQQIATAVMTMMMGHDQHAKTPANRIRKADGLPYGVHPLLAGSLMLHEMSIPVPKRLVYANALFFHDFKEDTNGSLTLVSVEARPYVELLTFDDSVDSADEAIKRGHEIAMLKSYDTVGNLFGLDTVTAWPKEKKEKRLAKAEKLFAFARPHYPDLLIWPIADALVKTMRERIG